MENMTTSSPEKEVQTTLRAGLKELLSLSEEERKKYFTSLDAYRTHISIMKNEREEGREEERMKFIRHLFSKGMDVNEIADLLDLETHAVEYVLTTPQE